MRRMLFLCLLAVLLPTIGVQTTQAQIRDLNERNEQWERPVVIGLPDDQDEDEDEDGDLPVGALCDPSLVTCGDVPPDCPKGYVPEVNPETGCWGGCTHFLGQPGCQLIPCSGDSDCPQRTHCGHREWPRSPETARFCHYDKIYCTPWNQCNWEPDENCAAMGWPGWWIHLTYGDNCGGECFPPDLCELTPCECDDGPEGDPPCWEGLGCPEGHRCVPWEGNSGPGLCVY